jgi:hypothetical protein
MHVGESAHPGFAPLFAGKKEGDPFILQITNTYVFKPIAITQLF